MRLVLVEWEDSRTADGGWRYIKDACELKAVKCQTVGWLLEQTLTSLLIAQSVGDLSEDESQTMGRTAIAVRQITKIVDLLLGQTIWTASTTSCPGLVLEQTRPAS